MSHKSSTARRNVGTRATLVGFPTLQGVDPASTANLLDARTSTRPSFARYEFCETSGLGNFKPGQEGIVVAEAEFHTYVGINIGYKNACLLGEVGCYQNVI